MRHPGSLLGFVLILTLTACGSPDPAPDPAAPAASTTPKTSAPVFASPSPTGAATQETSNGCPANDVPVPTDADPVAIGDVDRDGRPDTAFYTEANGFYYGIRTGSGATILLDDDLAGPGKHNGWTSIREKATVTVLDDSRTASLHAFIDCAFVTTVDHNGEPYRFGLKGFSDYGTGVQCTDDNGGGLLYGVLAKRRNDGLYDITRTQILLEDSGRAARNGPTDVVAEGLTADDSQVALAMRSTCGEAPIVSTSGR